MQNIMTAFSDVYFSDQDLVLMRPLLHEKDTWPEIPCLHPAEPTKFRIKLYQVCEAKSDYCLGLYFYTGRAPCIQYAEAIGIGEEKNVTIENMVGLLTRYGLLWFHLYLLASIFGDLV